MLVGPFGMAGFTHNWNEWASRGHEGVDTHVLSCGNSAQLIEPGCCVRVSNKRHHRMTTQVATGTVGDALGSGSRSALRKEHLEGSRLKRCI